MGAFHFFALEKKKSIIFALEPIKNIIMTQAEYLEVCRQRWEDIQNLSNLNSLYEIEKELDVIWTDLGSKILESSIGDVPTNHRKKKSSKRSLVR